MAGSEISQGSVLACSNTAVELLQNVQDDEQVVLGPSPGEWCSLNPGNFPSGDSCANPLEDPRTRWADPTPYDRLVYIKALLNVVTLAVESMPPEHVYSVDF